MVKAGGIPVRWEPADLKVVPFQPSARPTSGIPKVNGGWWERRGEGRGKANDCRWSYGWTPCNVQHGAVGVGATASGQRTLRAEREIESWGRSGNHRMTTSQQRANFDGLLMHSILHHLDSKRCCNQLQ
jgi:hypothetical protein